MIEPGGGMIEPCGWVTPERIAKLLYDWVELQEPVIWGKVVMLPTLEEFQDLRERGLLREPEKEE